MKKISFYFCFFLISCNTRTPELYVIGIQTEEALSFLEQYQQAEEKQKEDFDLYLQELRVNSSPGFEWDQYWSGIEKKKLFQNLEEEELRRLFSLTEISCEQKNWSAFSNLLLQIAKLDPTNLLFSKYLTDLQRICFTWLPDPAFKAVLQFLSDKREQEAKKISEQHKAYRENRQSVADLLKESETESEVEKYIYTEELKKVLSDEKSKKYTARNWDNVLEAVDRDFWLDARWISYQSKNREHLKNLLEIEWNTYKNIKNGLNIDILLMFEEKNKMEDIIRLVQYEKYFPEYKSLNWETLWKRVSLKYSENPENGNVERLLSLYKYSSCKEEERLSYIKVLDQWRMSSQREKFVDFCDELRRKQLNDYIGSRAMEELRAMADELYAKVLNDAREKAQRAGDEVKGQVIENILKGADIYHLFEAYIINQSRFKDPSGVAKKFRQEEWNRLKGLIQDKNHSQLEEILSPPFLWYVARILSFYSGENETFIKQTVGKLSGEEWSAVIAGLLHSYVSEDPWVNNYHFAGILHKVGLVYKEEVDTSLCSFFSREESLVFIQKYDSDRLLSLLEGIPRPHRINFTGRKYCVELIPKKRRNILLYELFQSLLKKKALNRKTTENALSDIWSVAVQIMDLSVKMNSFQNTSVWYQSLEALSNRKVKTNNYGFFIEFFELISEQLLSHANRNQVRYQLINHIWDKPPATAHHKVYRGWMEETLEADSSSEVIMILPKFRPDFLGK